MKSGNLTNNESSPFFLVFVSLCTNDGKLNIGLPFLIYWPLQRRPKPTLLREQQVLRKQIYQTWIPKTRHSRSPRILRFELDPSRGHSVGARPGLAPLITSLCLLVHAPGWSTLGLTRAWCCIAHKMRINMKFKTYKLGHVAFLSRHASKSMSLSSP